MINTDKAYIFGLIIGGGSFGSSKKSFAIKLPYDKWGDAATNPTRASKISQDIMSVVSPTMQNNYGLSTSYSASTKEWQILVSGNFAQLETDLKSYGIDLYQNMQKSARISKLCSALINDVLKKKFIAGLADTIGSTNPNHRRFSADVQIISFEFSGFNYDLVYEICKLFASTGCYADQILWNHPNMHSASDPYYTAWKKGFKLRVALDPYTDDMGFAFQSKTLSARDNLAKERKGKVKSIPCNKKPLSPNCSVLHPAENDLSLPPEIRGGHYIHHKQICAVLGCPFAPYKELDVLLAHAGEYVNPFPILYKAEKSDTISKLKSDKFLSKRTFTYSTHSLASLIRMKENGETTLAFGNGDDTGYPIGKILDAVNYIIQKQEGTLKGNRTTGNRDETLSTYLSTHRDFKVSIGFPDLMSVLLVEDISGKTCVLVGAQNPRLYQKLIVRDPTNKYKISVKEITEADYGKSKEAE